MDIIFELLAVYVIFLLAVTGISRETCHSLSTTVTISLYPLFVFRGDALRFMVVIFHLDYSYSMSYVVQNACGFNV